MLRWFPRLQVVTACFSCSPPDLKFLDHYFIFMYMHNNHCHRVTAHLQLNILLLLLLNVNNMVSRTVALNMTCPCTEMSAWWWLLVTETCSNFTLLNIQGDSKRWTQSRGRPELLPLHRQPICSDWWFQQRMLKRRRNARCTAVADSVLMNSRPQKILCCVVAILHSTDAAARLCARRAL